MICLSSNENPLGPGQDRARRGQGGVRAERRRARAGTPAAGGDLVDAHRQEATSSRRTSCSAAARRRSCASATHVFTAKDKPLVGTIPTYEECAGYAEMMGNPVRPVALDSEFKIDLDRLADAAKGAGLVFYCNPNNPTATYVGARATREFLATGQPRIARDDDPRRRGVLRLRHRSGSRHAHSDRRRGSAHHRRADVLEGVRDGRAAPRLRHRAPGHDQEDGGVGCRLGHRAR